MRGSLTSHETREATKLTPHFSEGVKYRGPAPLDIPIYKHNQELPFNFAAFDMPVLSDTVVTVIRRFAAEDVECFPVRIFGR